MSNDFNPRPREEGDSSLCNSGRSGGYFNPRPREEGDDWDANFPDMYDISIHALVKRATHCPPILSIK